MFAGVDKPLLYTTAVLLAGGFLVLASASIVLSQKNFGTIGYYTMRQFLMGGLGGAALFLISLHMPYHWWRRAALPLMIFSFLLLAVLFIPELSLAAGGARRWIDLGFLSFQPSEILKLSFVIYLASWLDARRQEVASVPYGMIPFAIMLGIVGVFILMQPDIGTLGVIGLTAVALYFIGGGRKTQVAAFAALAVAVFYFVVQLAPYRLARIAVFLNPHLDPQGIGYQIKQAFIAIGSGGFFGLGFGKSLQKYSYLPEPIGDSIFAVYAEELGFLGSVILISLFSFFLWRGIKIARNAPDVFGKFLAAGVVISITSQAFINMAAISGLLPLTGIPLPFVSYGGTSLAITLASVGILLNISKHAQI